MLSVWQEEILYILIETYIIYMCDFTLSFFFAAYPVYSKISSTRFLFKKLKIGQRKSQLCVEKPQEYCIKKYNLNHGHKSRISICHFHSDVGLSSIRIENYKIKLSYKKKPKSQGDRKKRKNKETLSLLAEKEEISSSSLFLTLLNQAYLFNSIFLYRSQITYKRKRNENNCTNVTILKPLSKSHHSFHVQFDGST